MSLFMLTPVQLQATEYKTKVMLYFLTRLFKIQYNFLKWHYTDTMHSSKCHTNEVSDLKLVSNQSGQTFPSSSNTTFFP
jgi:hypothetical protein